MIADATALWADVYQVDSQHTTVGFSIRHMVINNVKGALTDFTGTIESGGKDPLTIKVASLDTGIQGRDEHVRGPDFLDATQYPDIAFQSERVEKKGNGYALIGKFTMHGVTKEVTLPFTLSGPVVDPFGNTRIGIETGATLNRQDYGINWNKTLDNGGLLVGNEVKAEINAEAVKQIADPAKK
jgi:polyisoprenoid-binding protein YceI